MDRDIFKLKGLLLILLVAFASCYLSFAYPIYFFDKNNPIWMSYVLASFPFLFSIITILGWIFVRFLNSLSVIFLWNISAIVLTGWLFTFSFFGFVLVSPTPIWSNIFLLLIGLYFINKWFWIGFKDNKESSKKLNLRDKIFFEHDEYVEYAPDPKVLDKMENTRVNPSPFKDWFVIPITFLAPIAPALGLTGPKVFGSGVIESLIAGLSLILTLWGVTVLSQVIYLYYLTKSVEKETGKPVRFAESS